MDDEIPPGRTNEATERPSGTSHATQLRLAGWIILSLAAVMIVNVVLFADPLRLLVAAIWLTMGLQSIRTARALHAAASPPHELVWTVARGYARQMWLMLGWFVLAVVMAFAYAR